MSAENSDGSKRTGRPILRRRKGQRILLRPFPFAGHGGIEGDALLERHADQVDAGGRERAGHWCIRIGLVTEADRDRRRHQLVVHDRCHAGRLDLGDDPQRPGQGLII
jgi:hypothetical protein